MKTIRFLCTVQSFVLLFAGAATAAPEDVAPKSSSGVYGGMAAFFEFEGGDGAGKLGFGLRFEFISMLEVRVGGDLFSAHQFFEGIEAGARAKLPLSSFTPFIGVGGFWGENRLKCSLSSASCEEKFLNLGYTELGVYLLKFSVYLRYYSLRETSREKANPIAVGVGYSITGD